MIDSDRWQYMKNLNDVYEAHINSKNSEKIHGYL